MSLDQVPIVLSMMMKGFQGLTTSPETYGTREVQISKGKEVGGKNPRHLLFQNDSLYYSYVGFLNYVVGTFYSILGS